MLAFGLESIDTNFDYQFTQAQVKSDSNDSDDESDAEETNENNDVAKGSSPE